MPEDVNVPLLPINSVEAKPDIAGTSTQAPSDEGRPQSDKPTEAPAAATPSLITNEVRVFAVTIVVLFIGAVFLIIRNQKVSRTQLRGVCEI